LGFAVVAAVACFAAVIAISAPDRVALDGGVLKI
jgi:hypothetical protein